MIEEIDPLDRMAACDSCGWVGRYGETIAKDVLRCPECDCTVHVVIHKQHETVQ